MSRDDQPSRSARKRESQSLQDLGERIVDLKEEELARVPLPEDLATAVQLARHIKERGGRRRQLQYIGKLMRRIDTEEIARAIEAIDSEHHHEADQLHRVEAWRDRLLREGMSAIDALCAEHPEADREQLTRLVQEALSENTRHHGPRAARELFRYLRDRVFPSI